MTVLGTRLFGGTDTVPGLFHVATKFFHINFLPLVPLSSYLVLKRRGTFTHQLGWGNNAFQGIEIPMSGKSVALGYIRALATIGIIVADDTNVDHKYCEVQVLAAGMICFLRLL